MNKKFLFFLLLFLPAAACAPKVDNRGYVSEVDWGREIIPGKTTKDEVLAQHGSPSSQSSFGEESWYYITQRKETTAFMATEVAQQDVMRIVFDESGVAQKVERYNQDNAQEFDMVKRTTPTEGHTLGFVEQVLGNIGRFNKSSGSSPSPGRRSSGY